MHKLLITSSSFALLTVSMVSFAATEVGPCLEMYCPYGCDPHVPRCCKPIGEYFDATTQRCLSCAEPTSKSCSIPENEVDDHGCVVVEKIECSGENSVCNKTTGECMVCPPPTEQSCTIERDTKDPNGCVVVQKMECSGDTSICNEDKGTCQAPCQTYTDCDGNEFCDVITHECKTCTEPYETSCSIAADTTNEFGCPIKKVVCSGKTPVCNQESGICEKGCSSDVECKGVGQYCDAETHLCTQCPTDLPNKDNAKCNFKCGCAQGLSCLPDNKSACGLNGICKSYCEDNKDCAKGEYCAFEDFVSQCDKGLGQCRPIGGGRSYIVKSSDRNSPFYFSCSVFCGNSGGWEFETSNAIMSWWSAENWCKAQGMYLTSVYDDLQCYNGNSKVNSLSNNDATQCCKKGTTPKKSNSWCQQSTSYMSKPMREFRETFGDDGCYWTAKDSNCHAYTIGLEANQIWNTPKTGRYYFTTDNYMHALCDK